MWNCVCSPIRLSAGVVLPSLAMGLSSFIMQASKSVISICFNSSLLKLGAMTILTSVMQFAMLPLQGLGQGAQPIISYNYGAGKAHRVKATFKLLLKSSLVYSTLLWACVMLFPQGFAAMFTNSLAVYMAEPVADFIAVSFTAIFFFQFRKALRQMSEK